MTHHKKVAVLLYPGCVYFEIAQAVTLLSKHFDVLHFTPDGSAHAEAGGSMIEAQGSYGDLEQISVDCLLVPGGDPGSIISENKAKLALQIAAQSGALIAGICAGNLVLASAGLLKGVRATHNYTPEYAPLEKVKATAPFWEGMVFERADLVEDANIITAQYWAHEEFAALLAKRLAAAG